MFFFFSSCSAEKPSFFLRILFKILGIIFVLVLIHICEILENIIPILVFVLILAQICSQLFYHNLIQILRHREICPAKRAKTRKEATSSTICLFNPQQQNRKWNCNVFCCCCHNRNFYQEYRHHFDSAAPNKWKQLCIHIVLVPNVGHLQFVSSTFKHEILLKNENISTELHPICANCSIADEMQHSTRPVVFKFSGQIENLCGWRRTSWFLCHPTFAETFARGWCGYCGEIARAFWISEVGIGKREWKGATGDRIN